VIDRLRPQVAAMALNANGDPARFAQFGLPVVPDPVDGHAGPLAGVLAGMDWAAGRGATHVATVAGDTPFFPHDLVTRLMAGAGPAAIGMAATPDGLQPTFGLWPVALRGDLALALEAGTRKVAAWADAAGAVPVAFQNADAFFNVNTPDDLAQAQARLERGA